MIDQALGFLSNDVTRFIQAKSSTTADNTVILCPIVGEDGKASIPAGKISLFLLNMEEDRIGKEQGLRKIEESGNATYINPEIRLILHVLFVTQPPAETATSTSSDETHYKASLGLISHIIDFFENKPVFHAENSPGLPDRIEKLIVNLRSLNLEQQNYVWGTIGCPMLPSVMYEVRMVLTPEDRVVRQAPSVRIISEIASSKDD